MKKRQYPTDRYLIQQYLDGDTTALSVLVKRYHKTFCEKAYWVTKDVASAKDVAQECWLIIIKKLNTLEQLDSFRSWAFRIVYTKAIDSVKYRNKEIENLNSVEIQNGSNHSKKNESSQVQEVLLKAIQLLPKHKQDIIRLFYAESYTITEISTFLNIPKGTVKSRLFKAREKLKSLLKNKL